MKLCRSWHKTIQKAKDLALLWIFLLKAKRRKRSHRTLILLELWACLYLHRSKKTGHLSSLKYRINWKRPFSVAPKLHSSLNTTELESWAKFPKHRTSFYPQAFTWQGSPGQFSKLILFLLLPPRPLLLFFSFLCQSHKGSSTTIVAQGVKVFFLSLFDCILISVFPFRFCFIKVAWKRLTKCPSVFPQLFDQILHYFLKEKKNALSLFSYTCSV